MNRRNFIRKVLGTGAVLYVPQKTYGFLFADKCGAWRAKRYFLMRMTCNENTGLWTPASPDLPDLVCKFWTNMSKEDQSKFITTRHRMKSGWVEVNYTGDRAARLPPKFGPKVKAMADRDLGA